MRGLNMIIVLTYGFRLRLKNPIIKKNKDDYQRKIIDPKPQAIISKIKIG